MEFLIVLLIGIVIGIIFFITKIINYFTNVDFDLESIFKEEDEDKLE